LDEKWVKTIDHEGLYFEHWITFILYVLANKSFHFESNIIYGTPSVVISRADIVKSYIYIFSECYKVLLFNY
jgi:hypothetical protein